MCFILNKLIKILCQSKYNMLIRALVELNTHITH